MVRVVELAFLEEENLRVLVPVEDGGTSSWRDRNLQDVQHARGVLVRSLDHGYVGND